MSRASVFSVAGLCGGICIGVFSAQAAMAAGVSDKVQQSIAAAAPGTCWQRQFRDVETSHWSYSETYLTADAVLSDLNRRAPGEESIEVIDNPKFKIEGEILTSRGGHVHIRYKRVPCPQTSEVPADVAVLLNDSNICWQIEEEHFSTIETGPVQRDKLHFVTFGRRKTELKVDRSDPAKPKIVGTRLIMKQVPCPTETPPPVASNTPPSVNSPAPVLPPGSVFSPPPSAVTTPIGGLDVGVTAETSRFQSTFIEFFAPTGQEESRNSFGSTGVTVGGHVGFVIPWVAHPPSGGSPAPAVGPLLIEPFVDITDPNKTSMFPFAGGSFISVKRNFEATFGVNAGPSLVVDPVSNRTLWVFGTVGVSVENQTYTVNFIPISSSESKTNAALTVGFGGALTLPGIQVLGMPIALTAEYRHTFWPAAHFNMPASSPFSNFKFEGDDDQVAVGVRAFFWGVR